MLRGSSSCATRPCKKLRMRRACWWSSCLRFLTAPSDSSICQAILLHNVFQGHGLGFTGTHRFKLTLCQINVLQVIQVLLDGFDHVEGLRAACLLSQMAQTLVQFWGEAKR